MSTKRRVFSIITTILSGIVVMFSCTNKKADETAPSVSFRKDILPLFRQSCAVNGDCHSGSFAVSNNIDLTDSVAYSTIMAKRLVYIATPAASVLYNEVVTGNMPKAPYPKLSAENTKLILNWIQQGAKEN